MPLDPVGFSFATEASALTTGLTYKLCMDMDGALQELSFLDTGLSVQVTGVTGLKTQVFNVAGNTELQLTTALPDGSLSNAYGYVGLECSTAFSSGAGERNSVEQTVLGVSGGVIGFPLTVLGLVQGKPGAHEARIQRNMVSNIT